MQSFDFEIGTNCGVPLRLAFTVSLNDHVEHCRSQNQLASAVTFEARNIAQSRSSKSRHNRLMDRGLVQSLQFRMNVNIRKEEADSGKVGQCMRDGRVNLQWINVTEQPLPYCRGHISSPA